MRDNLQLEVSLDVVDPRFDGASADAVQLAPGLTVAIVERRMALSLGRALAAEGVHGKVQVAIVLTDDADIRDLNARYRGVDAVTDVLSFSQEEAGGEPAFVAPPEAPRLLGDVVINLEQARRQADEHGHSLERELAYLAVHATLHLMGYDHEDEVQRAAMRAREEAALADLPRKG